MAVATAAGAVLLSLNLAFAAVAAALDTDTPTAPPANPTAPALENQFAPDPIGRLNATPVVYIVPTSRPAPHIRLAPSADGISSVALTAYLRAATGERSASPSCRIPWELIASIGYIESDDGQIGGDHLDAQGQEASPVEGVPLDGNGVALIPDNHGGYARAEGPMQFLPTTWASWRSDGNGDGREDPQNMFDATAGAARYLCSGNADLSQNVNQPAVITLYNDSPIYVKNVMNVEHAYELGRSAATVKLIPMPATCPSSKAKPKHIRKTPTAAPTTAPPSQSPTICARPKKKHHRKAKVTTEIVIAARRSTTPTRAPAPSPSPSPTPTQTPVAVIPTPSPSTPPTSTPTASGTPTP